MSHLPTATQIKDAFVEIISMVHEFHECFGHPVGQQPCGLNMRRADQRFGYLAEELLEGHAAGLAENRVEMVDAVGDAIYFLAGNLVECGIYDDRARQVIAGLIEVSDADLEASMVSLTSDMRSKGTVGEHMRRIMLGALGEFTEYMSDWYCGADSDEDVDLIPISSGTLFGMMTIAYTLLEVDTLEVLREIHRSNMGKLLPATLDSETACRAFMEFNGCKVPPIELKFERLDDMRWVAKHIGTNKIIKNPLYPQVNLEPLLN